MNHHLTHTRPLGDQERYLHNLHLFGGLIGTMQLDVKGPLNLERVRTALDGLQARHAILQAHIKFKGFARSSNFPWVFRQAHFDSKGTSPIPLRVATITTDQDLHNVIQDEFKKPIRGPKCPRLRAIFIADWPAKECHKLILATDHAVVDAQAMARMANDLMELLANPNPQPIHHNQNKLPPSLESCLPAKSNKKPKSYQPAIRIPHKFSRTQPRQTHTLAHSFSKNQTKSLKQAIKQNRTTLHGLMAASMLKALAQKYALEQMTCLSSVEFRRMCAPPVPDDAMGCYIDTLRTEHKTNKTVWPLAREISFKLISTLAHNQASASILKFPSMAELLSETWPVIMSGMRLDGLAITTAGKFNLAQSYGKFTLQDIILTMSLSSAGAGILVMTFERAEKLTINMCFTTPDLTPAEGQELLDGMIQNTDAKN